jgi:hypothetical protein
MTERTDEHGQTGRLAVRKHLEPDWPDRFQWCLTRPSGTRARAACVKGTNQTDGRTDGQTDRQTERQASKRTHGRPDEQTDGQACGRMIRRADKQTVGRRTDRRTDWQTDRRTVMQTEQVNMWSDRAPRLKLPLSHLPRHFRVLMPSQAELADLWLAASPGRLSPFQQMRVLRLSEPASCPAPRTRRQA